MTDDIRAELTLQRDYLRRALEMVEAMTRTFPTSILGNMFMADLAQLRGYLSGGLEMVEHRLSLSPKDDPLDKYLSKPGVVLCSHDPDEELPPSEPKSTKFYRGI